MGKRRVDEMHTSRCFVVLPTPALTFNISYTSALLANSSASFKYEYIGSRNASKRQVIIRTCKNNYQEQGYIRKTQDPFVEELLGISRQ